MSSAPRSLSKGSTHFVFPFMQKRFIRHKKRLMLFQRFPIVLRNIKNSQRMQSKLLLSKSRALIPSFDSLFWCPDERINNLFFHLWVFFTAAFVYILHFLFVCLFYVLSWISSGFCFLLLSVFLDYYSWFKLSDSAAFVLKSPVSFCNCFCSLWMNFTISTCWPIFFSNSSPK